MYHLLNPSPHEQYQTAQKMTFMILKFRILSRFVTVDVRNYEGMLKGDAL